MGINRLTLLSTFLLYILLPQWSTAKNIVFFHPGVPSNLYVNAAHGPTDLIKDPDGQTDIIRLLLYPTDKRAKAPKTARVVLIGANVTGVMTLRQDNPPVGHTFVSATIEGLTPGMHGMHIREQGDLQQGCSNLALGGHYNPYHRPHGRPSSRFRHVGDLGNVVAEENGKAQFSLDDAMISLVGPRTVIGRALTISANEDVYKGEDRTESIEACGVIGYAF